MKKKRGRPKMAKEKIIDKKEIKKEEPKKNDNVISDPNETLAYPA